MRWSLDIRTGTTLLLSQTPSPVSSIGRCALMLVFGTGRKTEMEAGRGRLRGFVVAIANLLGVWDTGFSNKTCLFSRAADKLRNLGWTANRIQTQGCSEQCILKAFCLDLGPSSFGRNAIFVFDKYHRVFVGLNIISYFFLNIKHKL